MTTLADLRARMYARFDEGQQNYVTVPEANTLINEGAAHLHNWIVNSAEFYIWNEYVFSVVFNQMDYVLPSDFMKVLKVFAVSNGCYFPIDRIMPEEFRGSASTQFRAANAYMVMGNKLRLMPGVTTKEIALWYAPSYQPMVSDIDVPAVSIAPGWEEFIVNQAVIACRIKEESDTTQLERRQAQIMKMVEESIANRDMGRHQRVVDVDNGV